MSALKRLASLLPARFREPLLNVWRRYLGNPEIAVLKMLSERSKTSIDVGANAGTYAIVLAGVSKHCIAFEPIPELARDIKERLGPFGVTVHACALSDRAGTAKLRIPVSDDGENPQNSTLEPDDLSVGPNTRAIDVPLKRLDDFVFGPIGFIKIDAEGHEDSVLRGALGLIQRDRPNVMLEADDHRHKAGSVAAVLAYFRALNYQGFFLLGRQIVPISEFRATTHQNASSLDEQRKVIFGRLYVDTFIFSANDSMIAKLNSLARQRASF
jgi:FkbM family methyltransferase